jgi:acyl-coenzyme A thioesterase PaaI-like protein
MKKIINPWKNMEGYNCFGCSPDNEAGVRMEFYEDGDEVVSIWKPRPEYQGWLNTLHGGIQSVLLDEICGWVVFRKLQTGGVTSKMETRFRKSISTNDTHLVLRASLREQKRNIAIIEASCITAWANSVRKPHAPTLLSRRKRRKRKCVFIIVM